MRGRLATCSAKCTALAASVARLSLFRSAVIVFVAALIPRAYFAVVSMEPVACDEIFQTVEVAHKVAFGRGFLYWEWSQGLRSYILPGFLAGIYRLLDAAGVRDPYTLAVGLKFMLALLHAGGWVFLFLFFALFLTRFSALLVAVASGFLYVGAFVAVRTLGETIAFPFMMAALYLTARAADRALWRSALWAGLLVGIAFAVRFQSIFFSAGLFLVLVIVSRERRLTAGAFSIGAIGVLLLMGFIDLATWGSFLQSVVKYFEFNVLQDGASRFGREPWWYYFVVIPKLYPWSLIVPAVVFTIVASFHRRAAFLAVPLLLYVAAHVLVPHKEVRFLFPAYVLFGVAGMAAWERLSLLAALAHRPLAALLGVSIALFSAIDTDRAVDPAWARSHRSNNAQNMEPSFALGRLPDIKKGFVLNLQRDFSGGHAYFHAAADIEYVRHLNESRTLLFAELRRALPGRYFAIRKKDERHFAQYLPLLEKVAETAAWAIYRRDRTVVIEPENIALSRLATPRREGAAWDAPGTVRVWEMGLRVSLGAVRNEGALELSADNNDRYELSFNRDGATVGRAVAEPQSGKKGLVIHRLDIPASARESGYDEIVIMPSGGDGVYSVGHLMLSR